MLDDTRIDFHAVGDKAILEANNVFAIYYGHYCIRKVDPDPVRPIPISVDNAAQFGVGVPAADWALFENRKARFDRFIGEDVQGLIDKLKKVLPLTSA